MRGGSLPGFPADLVPATAAVRAPDSDGGGRSDVAPLRYRPSPFRRSAGRPPCWRCWPGTAGTPRLDHSSLLGKHSGYDEASEAPNRATGNGPVRPALRTERTVPESRPPTTPTLRTDHRFRRELRSTPPGHVHRHLHLMRRPFDILSHHGPPNFIPGFHGGRPRSFR
jgi:hypothetical protein